MCVAQGRIDQLNGEFDCVVALKFQKGVAESEAGVVAGRGAAKREACDAARALERSREALRKAAAASVVKKPPPSTRADGAVGGAGAAAEGGTRPGVSNGGSSSSSSSSSTGTVGGNGNGARTGCGGGSGGGAVAAVAVAEAAVAGAAERRAFAVGRLDSITGAFRGEAARCDALRRADLRDVMLA